MSKHIEYFWDLVQGTDEWLEVRCGVLTASEVDRVITPTLKVAENAASKTHLYDLMAQRVTGYVAPSYISDAMLRGEMEEELAKATYAKHYGVEVKNCGHIRNTKLGFPLGFSPDGLIGDDGLIEIKSRADKFQMQTIVQHAMAEEPTVPKEYALQVQMGLLVSERQWCDFISYCGGLPMVRIRAFPDPKYQAALTKAATQFESKLYDALLDYREWLQHSADAIPTERTQTEMY